MADNYREMIFITMHSKFQLKNIIVFAFWIVVWQILYMIVNEPLFLAGPFTTLKSLVKILKEAGTYGILLKSTGKIIGGFFVSLLLAVFTAFVAWSVKIIREGLTPLMAFAKAVPIASVIVLFLAWFSSSGISGFVAGFVAFPLVYFEILSALDNIDLKILEMLKVYRVTFFKRMRYVYFPAICNRLFVTAKIAVGMCIRAGVAAELIGVPSYSIGEKLYKAKLYLEIGDLFAWTIVIVAAGYICEKIMIGTLKIIGRKAGSGK